MIARTYTNGLPFSIIGHGQSRDGLTFMQNAARETQENAAIAYALVGALPFERSREIAHLILNVVENWDDSTSRNNFLDMIQKSDALKAAAGDALEK